MNGLKRERAAKGRAQRTPGTTAGDYEGRWRTGRTTSKTEIVWERGKGRDGGDSKRGDLH